MQTCHFDVQQHLEPVLALYQRAIHALDEGLYDQQQRRTWSAWANDSQQAGKLLSQGVTLLARNPQQEVMGFAQLWQLNCINMLYVDPAYGRQGVGSALILQMETQARLKGVLLLNTRASKASQPLFQRLGYVARQQEWVRAEGVSLSRMHMVKSLTASINH